MQKWLKDNRTKNKHSQINPKSDSINNATVKEIKNKTVEKQNQLKIVIGHKKINKHKNNNVSNDKWLFFKSLCISLAIYVLCVMAQLLFLLLGGKKIHLENAVLMLLYDVFGWFGAAYEHYHEIVNGETVISFKAMTLANILMAVLVGWGCWAASGPIN